MNNTGNSAPTGNPAPQPSRRPRLFTIFYFLFPILVLPATLATTLIAWLSIPLPTEIASPGPVPSLTLEDRHGLTLRTTRAEDGSRGGWVPLNEVAPTVLQAFLAAEDHRFFEHRGVDLRAVARAARDNFRAGRVVSGASTITMQTARLLRPTPRTWRGKLAQLLWALKLEWHLEKSTILEHYLNRVPLGQGAVGVAAGASLYFGTDARELSLGQAALLAALAHAPSRDNPLVDPDRARRQRRRVLERMVRRGYAGVEDMARAELEPVVRPGAAGIFLAPHFTTRLLLAAAEGGWTPVRGVAATSPAPVGRDVEDGAGFAGSPRHPELTGPPGARSPTGTWRTTLDLELQRALEAEVRHAVAVLHDRNVRHAAVVVLDNPTGGILAWVGSPDFWAPENGQVDMVASPRQPGSALKPFLFGLAFDRGYTPATVLPDVPRTYQTATGPYQPRNYDRRYRGPVRARVALGSSLNVPAVELAARLGPAALLQTLRDAGFASLTRPADHYGLGLALGNGEVTLLELANAFRGLANGGVWTPVRWLAHEAGLDDVVRRRFLSQGAAMLVLDILSDPVARIPGFGTETPFDFAFPAAAKTGTSRHFTDNWAVVVTGNFTVAVWVGNFSGQPMQGVSGISGAGPLVYRAVLETARRYPPGHLPTPEEAGASPLPVCLLSGLRATPDCASTIEWFLPGTEPTRPDDWERDGRIVLPAEYAEWAVNAGVEARVAVGIGDGSGAGHVAYAGRGEPDGIDPSTAPGAPHDAPTSAAPGERYGTSSGVTPGTSPREANGAATARFRITSPLDGDIYEVPVGVDPRYATIPLIATGDVNGVRWTVNGRPLHGTRWRLEPGEHLIRAENATGEADSVRIRVR